MKTIKVEAMSCMHCVKSIKEALDAVGIINEVSLDEKTVQVKEVDVVQALSVLETIQYTGEVV